MSYKVEITAATTAELAGKLLALAATMQTTPADPVMPEVKETAKPKKAPARKVEEAAEEPAGEPQTSSGEPSQPAKDTSSGQPAEKSDTPEAAPQSSDLASPAEASEPLDFEKDVTPVVLAAVKDKGRDFVASVLTQFGVERASQVPDEQFGELIAMLKGDA
jgi:hypothetical protein